MHPDWRWYVWSEIDRDLWYEVTRLREAVFVVEQACAFQDADGLDPRAAHLVGHHDRRIVAYLRAFGPDDAGEARIGRVVTAPEARGAGLGRALMREGAARVYARWGPVPIHVSAQAHLERFYASLGYAVCGPGYDEDGIPHLPMRAPAPGPTGAAAAGAPTR